MKKLYIFFVFCLNISYGQVFTVNELINMSNMNTDEFDTFAISKGYAFFKVENDDYSDNIIYAHKLKYNNIAPSYIAKYSVKKKPKTIVSFQTSEKEIYISIKNQINQLGFVFVGTDTDENKSIFLDYKKGEIKLTLTSILSVKNPGNTYYEISITNPNK